MLILHGFVNIDRPPGAHKDVTPVHGGITREVIHTRLSLSTDGRRG
jgi:hypothetical protein